MKLSEKQLRDILDGQQFAVDPQHEAAFRAMLLHKKRRRRLPFFVLLLAALGLIAAIYLVGPGDAVNHTDQSKLESKVDNSAIKTSTSSASEGNHNEANVGDALSSSSSESSQTSDPLSPDVNSRDIEIEQPVQAFMQSGSNYNQESPSTDNAALTNPIVSNNSLEITDDYSINAVEQNTGEIPVKPEELLNTATKEFTAGNKESTPLSQNASKLMTQAESELTPVIANEPSEMVETTTASDKAIIPANAPPPRHLTFGVTTSGYAMGYSGDGGWPSGYGVKLGAYAAYPVSGKLSLRMDGGFSLINGGFEFSKESESGVYGFSLLKLNNKLTIQRLYAGYVSLETGWTLGKYMLAAGLEGTYYYGGKGDIYKEELPVDSPGPRNSTAEDQWVSLDGLSRFTLSGNIMARTRIASRLELAGGVRIPLTRAIRLKDSSNDYSYSIHSSGISPVISLSYQLNKHK